MAITTYAELQTAIATWLARDDLVTYIPDFITLFEAAACRRLRVREMETLVTLTPASGSVNLPSDYLSTKRLTWTGSVRVELVYMHPSALQATFPDTPSGTPLNYTIEAGAIKIRPTDTTALELVYLAKNTAAATTLSWLFTRYPDAYLFGSLVEAYMFNKDPQNASIWQARLDNLFAELKSNDFNTRGAMAITVMGATP